MTSQQDTLEEASSLLGEIEMGPYSTEEEAVRQRGIALTPISAIVVPAVHCTVAETQPPAQDEQLGSVLGAALSFFALYSVRFLCLPWLWSSSANTFSGARSNVFIPVISPVYRQQEHWSGATKRAAVVIHIITGAVMLACGIVQFDKKIRRNFPSFHRWTGRLYIICGIICTCSLIHLIDSVGAGSSSAGRSDSLALFVQMTSCLWLLCTASGVIAAINRKYDLHRDFMALSLGLAAVPIAQRFYSWSLLTPASMVIRIVLCSYRDDIIPLKCRWGPPEGSYSLLFVQTTIPFHQSINGALDPRSSPFVISLDGYGEAEQVCFALSAWMAFVTVVLWGFPRLLQRVFPHSSRLLSLIGDTRTLSEFRLFDSIRSLAMFMEKMSGYFVGSVGHMSACGGGGRVLKKLSYFIIACCFLLYFTFVLLLLSMMTYSFSVAIVAVIGSFLTSFHLLTEQRSY